MINRAPFRPPLILVDALYAAKLYAATCISQYIGTLPDIT